MKCFKTSRKFYIFLDYYLPYMWFINNLEEIKSGSLKNKKQKGIYVFTYNTNMCRGIKNNKVL